MEVRPHHTPLSLITYICWYDWQLRFLWLRQRRNLTDADGRNALRRPENHFLISLLFISCSSVSSDTLISPITSNTSNADGPNMVIDCERDRLVKSRETSFELISGVEHLNHRQGYKATHLVGQPVQSWVQDVGEFREQHLPQHFGVAAVSRQVALEQRHQLIGCEVLQLHTRHSHLVYLATGSKLHKYHIFF